MPVSPTRRIQPAPPAARRRWHRGSASIGATIAQAFATLMAGGGAALQNTLPVVDGELPVAALTAPATIERDAQGLITITATNELDAYRALGVAHAQDRLFQMDGSRRSAAGRLAEWLGNSVLQEDESARAMFLPEAAARAFNELTPRERDMLIAYTEGVNAGIASLKAPPPEYAILGVEPEPWTPTDSLLVALNMCRYLAHTGGTRERQLANMQANYPPEVVAFFTQQFSRFDTVNEVANFGSWAFEPATPPDASVIDLQSPRVGFDLPEPESETASLAAPTPDRVFAEAMLGHLLRLPPEHPVPHILGSNNWAIAGGRTEHGGAILANDMHLELMAPNVWYRAHMRWKDEQGEKQIVGLTLPGLPGVIAGSNTFVAWGFTNVHGDFVDNILIELNPDNPQQYRVPGPTPTYEDLGSTTVTIKVRGENPVERHYRTTRWGPITGSFNGKPVVVKWTCTEPGGLNLALLTMVDARNAAEAARIAASWHGPPQNVAIADRHGSIAMVISGYIPKRLGYDGSLPTSWADGRCRWDGQIAEQDRYAVLGSGKGRVISANSRVTSDLLATKLLGEPFTLGIRQYEIERALRPFEQATEADMLAVQLDTRSSFHDFYRDLLLAHIPEETDDETLKQIRDAVLAWDGHANASSRGLVFLSRYAHMIRNRLLSAVAQHYATPQHRPGAPSWPLMEESIRRLIETQPRNFIPPRYDSWTAFLLESARDTKNQLEGLGIVIAAPWGVYQTTIVQHPLMMALEHIEMPAAAKRQIANRLNMPESPSHGSWTTIRVQTIAFGASERLVVSPGREEHAILHMPAGQSGNFLSPWFRAGHDDWAQGKASPLLAGPTQHTLELKPVSVQD